MLWANTFYQRKIHLACTMQYIYVIQKIIKEFLVYTFAQCSVRGLFGEYTNYQKVAQYMCIKCATFLMKINHKPWRLDLAYIQQNVHIHPQLEHRIT